MTKNTDTVPEWAPGSFLWRLNLADRKEGALEEAARTIEQVQNLLDREVRSIIITSGATGVDTGFQSWDGPWPYLCRASYRIGHDWKNFARFMLEMRDKHRAWISLHTNITDVNVGLSNYPEMQAFFEKLRAADAIYTREGGECGVPIRGPAYVPQRIPVETTKMPYVKLGDPGDIFAIVDYKKFWDSGLAREMVDQFFALLPYPPPVLYLDVLSATGNNLNAGYPDGLLGGSHATQEEGRRAILDYIKTKGSEPGGEGPMDCTRYNWNHGGLSANDYSRIQTGWAQGCYSMRGAEWQHVYGNWGAYSIDLTGKLQSQAVEYTPVEGGGTMMVGTSASSAPANETDEWRTLPQLVEGFYLTAIQELYHIGLRNTRLPGGPGIERLDEHRGRVALDRVDLYSSDRRLLTGAQADEGEVTKPCSVGSLSSASNGKVVTGLDVSLNGRCRIKLEVAEKDARAATLLVRYNSPLGGTLGVEVNGKFIGEFEFPATARGDIFGDLAISVNLQPGANTIAFGKGSIHAAWSDGTEARWDHTGFHASNGDVTFGVGYDRMWPDTWSGTKKIHFYSREGSQRTWVLPESWSSAKKAQLMNLTEAGRDKAITLDVKNRQVTVPLKPRMPAILIPA